MCRVYKADSGMNVRAGLHSKRNALFLRYSIANFFGSIYVYDIAAKYKIERFATKNILITISNTFKRLLMSTCMNTYFMLFIS